jgi:hypothetical protein
MKPRLRHPFFPVDAVHSAFATLVYNTIISAVAFALLYAGCFEVFACILFVAWPFVLGVTTVIFHGTVAVRGFLQFFGLSVLSLAIIFIAIVLYKPGGAGWLIVVAPLWIAIATTGTLTTYMIHARVPPPVEGTRGFPLYAWMLMALLPFCMDAAHHAF